MYTSFYNLRKKPFQISTDPRFLWLGEKHKEALATLKYGILDNKGVLLITGDVGTGKTTLINALVGSLESEVIVARIPDPGMEQIDLMNYISHSFGMGKEFARKDLFLIHFGHFLNTAYTRKKKVLLIIDEAQRLSQEMLEEVRQLSNIEREDTKLLNIFLIGQNEFNEVLLQKQNRALRQRITMHYGLERLNVHETGELIQYRLQVAGADGEFFTPEAIKEVFNHTGGTPRKINILCDHCMISGFASGRKTIDANVVALAAMKLALPGKVSTPIDIGDLLPDDDLFGDEETPEEEPQEESESQPEDIDANHIRHDKAWQIPVATAVILCGALLAVFIYFFQGFGGFASTIKNTARNIVSLAVDGGSRLAGQQKDLDTNLVSTTVFKAELPQAKRLMDPSPETYSQNDRYLVSELEGNAESAQLESVQSAHTPPVSGINNTKSQRPDDVLPLAEIKEKGRDVGIEAKANAVKAEEHQEVARQVAALDKERMDVEPAEAFTSEPSVSQTQNRERLVADLDPSALHEPDTATTAVVKESKKPAPVATAEIVVPPTTVAGKDSVRDAQARPEADKQEVAHRSGSKVSEEETIHQQPPEPIDSSKVIEWLLKNRGSKE